MRRWLLLVCFVTGILSSQRTQAVGTPIPGPPCNQLVPAAVEGMQVWDPDADPRTRRGADGVVCVRIIQDGEPLRGGPVSLNRSNGFTPGKATNYQGVASFIFLHGGGVVRAVVRGTYRGQTIETAIDVGRTAQQLANPPSTPMPTATAVPATSTATAVPTAIPTVVPTAVPTSAPPTSTATTSRTAVPTATSSVPTPTRIPTFNNCQADPSADSAPNNPIKIVSINKQTEVVTLTNVSTAQVNIVGWIMCSITGNQRHTPIGGVLQPGEVVAFPNSGGEIWRNDLRDDGALYNEQGQLVSYFIDPVSAAANRVVTTRTFKVYLPQIVRKK